MSAELQVSHTPDHAEQATDRLLVVWDHERIRALVEAFAEGVQDIEEQTWDVVASTSLEVATGDALDQWGELVGEQRLGLSDAEYRQFVLARMLVNLCTGTVDELLEILQTCTAPNVRVWHEASPPAGFYLGVDRRAWLADEVGRRVARMMEEARPAGRQMYLIEALEVGFGFDTDATAAGYGEGGLSRLILAG